MYYASLSYKCEYIKKVNTNRRKIFIKKKKKKKNSSFKEKSIYPMYYCASISHE